MMFDSHCLCRASDAVSLNAAIFAAVCLASRLPSALHAFVTVLFAVILFAFLPQLRDSLQVMCRTCDVPYLWCEEERRRGEGRGGERREGESVCMLPFVV